MPAGLKLQVLVSSKCSSLTIKATDFCLLPPNLQNLVILVLVILNFSINLESMELYSLSKLQIPPIFFINLEKCCDSESNHEIKYALS